MAKKQSQLDFVVESHVERELKNMTYKDLKKEVVMRGMDFEEVIKGSYFNLASFFQKNYHTPQNPNFLTQFDLWLENTIKKGGKEIHPAFLAPSLRLSYIAQREDDPSKSVVKVKSPLPSKPKAPQKEKTEGGIYKGTKKALTYQLQSEGVTKDKVIETVMGQFPDASIKSIGIWFNKAKKANGK